MTELPAAVEKSVEVENVVTSSSLGCNIDLDALNDDIEKAQYNAEQFPGLIYRSTDPQVTILVFRSGKLVCTGAKSMQQTEEVLDGLLETFDEIGLEYEDPSISVQNIVGVGNINEKLNLNAIAIAFGLEKTEYEPEQFPGVVYRMEEVSTVALLFGSGKIVITGGKEPDQITKGVEQVYSELTNYSLI